MGRNCHRHLWLLSGTGDGPPLAKSLILKGWKVSVSVVSLQAAQSYSQIPLQSICIGPLDGLRGIRSILKESKESENEFDWVIDATHPFAKEISSNLKMVCEEINQPLIRFERSCKTLEGAYLINSFDDFQNIDLSRQRLLLAIGSKFLSQAVNTVRNSGAVVFARVLPNVDSISKALTSNLPQDHLAILRPFLGNCGDNELALCRKWGITGVVIRQSGGCTQMLWQRIAEEQALDLWLISRPKISSYKFIFSNLQELIDFI